MWALVGSWSVVGRKEERINECRAMPCQSKPQFFQSHSRCCLKILLFNGTIKFSVDLIRSGLECKFESNTRALICIFTFFIGFRGTSNETGE